MLFWWLFAVLNAIYIGALLWCVMAIRSTTRIGAEVLDIHTNALRKQSAEIATLRESQFPRYTSAVVELPAECDTPPDWQAHDDRVRHALANPVPNPLDPVKLADSAFYASAREWYRKGGQAGWQDQPMRKPGSGGGVPMADPESAPFFTQSQPEK